MSWNDFWKEIYWSLLKAKTRPARETIGITVELGSGYSVEDERMADVEKLIEACRKAIVKYPPKKNAAGEVLETYCNWGLTDIAEAVGCKEIRGKTANEIQSFAVLNPQIFRQDTGDRAWTHAIHGGFAFAAQVGEHHGHVAAVAPLEMELSGSWNKKVPILANVGKENGLMRASKCFQVEPLYFLWGEAA